MKNYQVIRKITAVSAVLALSAATTGMFAPVQAQAVETLTGQTAEQITSQMVIGWNLGNTLDCNNTGLKSTSAPSKFVTKWGNPEPTKELFDTVKNAGFNTVRIPTTWYEHIEYDEASQMYVVNEDWMDYVEDVVDYAYDQGMFVILNIHHEDFINEKVFTDETYAVAAKKLGDIWTQVADTFEDYDQHLIFEGMNEPRQTGNPEVNEWGNGTEDGGYTSKYINDLNAVFVNTIRNQGSAENKERMLMLPGYCASSDFTSIRNIQIPENAGNVALSVHAYAPYFFTMDTSEYASHEFPGKSGYGEDYETALTNMFDGFKQIMQEKNTPIVIGEFSASDFNNTEARCNWAKSYLSKAKDAGIPCVLWDNNAEYDGGGEAHGYLYRLTNTWYPSAAPVIQSMMDVYGVQANLPEYVEYVSPEFSWDKVPKTDSWIEIFKSADGLELDAWDPAKLGQWKTYANENYDFVMVYDTIGEPALVLQDSEKESWDYINPSDTETPFVAYFTYEDFLTTLENSQSGVTLEEVDSLYMSATQEDLTVYGVYAVPKSGIDEPTSEPTSEDTTQAPSGKPEDDLDGDVNRDKVIDLLDVIALQRYLLGINVETFDNDEADVVDDDIINIYDLVALKRIVLSSK